MTRKGATPVVPFSKLLRTVLRYIAFWQFSAIVVATMVVRMRKNSSQTRKGRSHHALKDPALSTCSNCNELHRPHHMCLACGFYKGRQVMDMRAKHEKRAARIKAKQDRIRAEASEVQPETEEVTEDISTEDTSKEAREENDTTRRPEQKPE